MNNVQFDVRIRNIRALAPTAPRGHEDEKLRVVGDLWLKCLDTNNRPNGWKMIAAGKIKYLFEICNQRNYNLINYYEAMSSTKTPEEYRDWLKQQPPKR